MTTNVSVVSLNLKKGALKAQLTRLKTIVRDKDFMLSTLKLELN